MIINTYAQIIIDQKLQIIVRIDFMNNQFGVEKNSGITFKSMLLSYI